MTPAMKSMLNAMLSELKRQGEAGKPGPYVDDQISERDPEPDFDDIIVDGHVNLERVARAALVAIGAASEEQVIAMHEGFKAWAGEGGEIGAYREVWGTGIAHILGLTPTRLGDETKL